MRHIFECLLIDIVVTGIFLRSACFSRWRPAAACAQQNSHPTILAAETGTRQTPDNHLAVIYGVASLGRSELVIHYL